jgi:hypothetical protein
LLRFRKTVLVLGTLGFGLPVFLLPNRLEETNPLAAYYNPVFDNDLYAESIRPVVNKWLGGTLRLFVNYVYEGAVSSEPARTALYVVAELPNLGRYAEVDKTITQVNNGQEGVLTVYFRAPHDEGLFPYQLKNRAILLSTEMSGIEWDIYGVGQGFSQSLNEEETSTFMVELFGYNYADLEMQAKRLAVLLEKHPRIQTVNTNRSPSFFQRKSLYAFELATDHAGVGPAWHRRIHAGYVGPPDRALATRCPPAARPLRAHRGYV